MKFSVLIAHYNNYGYFKQCYVSLKNQTYQNFEIILVDDCSKDGSFEKIIELTKNDDRIKTYKNKNLVTLPPWALQLPIHCTNANDYL